MSILPIAFVLTVSFGSDWWALFMFVPMGVFGFMLGLYALNELVGFLGGYYLVYPKKGEMIFQKTGSIKNQRYSVPLDRADALEWRGRKSQLYFVGIVGWIYCACADAERIKEFFAQVNCKRKDLERA